MRRKVRLSVNCVSALGVGEGAYAPYPSYRPAVPCRPTNRNRHR
jgi:hypothetical protein